MKLTDLFKKLYWCLGLDITRALDSGISFFGLNVSRLHSKLSPRGSVALQRCISFKPTTVLDVGSGGGQHAVEFSRCGASVTCIDFGTSIYAKKAKSQCSIDVININFLNWNWAKKYDLVWASHVLEHQRNVGIFIEKLIDCCNDQGSIAITVPFPHRRLYGGHLTQWTPGLLVYNIVLCGIDLKNAELIYGFREFTIIFRPIRLNLPELTFDSGDICKLKDYLPFGLMENGDPWV